MVVVLVLGAFVIRQVSHGNYVVALAQALLVIGGILVAVSWLWDPRAGFAGIGHLLTRYFLSVGMPFERWMHSLANLADRERDPGPFRRRSRSRKWPRFPGSRASTGRPRTTAAWPATCPATARSARFGGLQLTLYTRWSPSPALVLHIRLLGRLLADYYETKRREQEQRQNAYMHAIYETGSRLTHDVKNLLQSLRSLCSAVETSDERDAAAVRRLVQRQLPQITQRLQSTLDKLIAAPRRHAPPLPRHWWRELQQRYAHEGVVFDPPIARRPADTGGPVRQRRRQLPAERAGETAFRSPDIRIRVPRSRGTGCS